MNGHVICTKCLIEIKKGTNKCPICSIMYPALPIRNLYAQTVIGDLPGTCADCFTPMARKELPVHRQTCSAGIVKCPFHFGHVQCNTEWNRMDLERHLTLDHTAHLALIDFLTADAIAPAIAWLRCAGSTDHAKFASTVTLEHMAHNKEYKVVMVDAGAIPALVAMVTGITTCRVKISATEALRTIAGDRTVFTDGDRLAIAQAGGIAPIVRLLCEGETILAKNAAACALGALAHCFDLVEVIIMAGAGVIEPLVALLSVHAADIHNIAATLETLANNSMKHRNKFKCRIPPLVALLSALDMATKEPAADALRNLCYNKANCSAVVQAGAVDDLVAMLRVGGGDHVNKSAADALRTIAEYGDKLSAQAVVNALISVSGSQVH